MFSKLYQTFFILILSLIWYGLALPICLNVPSTFLFVGGILITFVVTVESGRRYIKIWKSKEG